MVPWWCVCKKKEEESTRCVSQSLSQSHSQPFTMLFAKPFAKCARPRTALRMVLRIRWIEWMIWELPRGFIKWVLLNIKKYEKYEVKYAINHKNEHWNQNQHIFYVYNEIWKMFLKKCQKHVEKSSKTCRTSKKVPGKYVLQPKYWQEKLKKTQKHSK